MTGNVQQTEVDRSGAGSSASGAENLARKLKEARREFAPDPAKRPVQREN